MFGIVKRNGLVKAQPVSAHDRASILQVIQAESREGSLYYTDEWQAYATLRLRGDHVSGRARVGLVRNAPTSDSKRPSLARS